MNKQTFTVMFSGTIEVQATSFTEARNLAAATFENLSDYPGIIGCTREIDVITNEAGNEEHESSDEDPEACPGCGCLPGEGRTDDCNDPNGCGFNNEPTTDTGRFANGYRTFADGSYREDFGGDR